MNIYQIAEECGVSIATVSRVINHSPSVSEKTRKRVLRVMERHNYHPNAFARGLGLGTMKMVGILCADVSDPFYAAAVAHLESSLKQMGYDLLLYCTGYHLEDKRRYIRLLLEKNVDGIILVGSVFAESTDNSHIEASAEKVPVIIVNGSLPSEKVYSVDGDSENAFRTAVEKLWQNGARRILYLYDVLTYGGQRKLAGYLQGLALCNLPPEAELSLVLPRDLDKAVEALQKRFALRDFDAVLSSEDLFAVAAGKALSQLGMRIPIIGCNNSVLSKCATPSITSIDLMLEHLCQNAANTLNTLLSGGDAPHRVTISSRLYERETFPLK